MTPRSCRLDRRQRFEPRGATSGSSPGSRRGHRSGMAANHGIDLAALNGPLVDQRSARVVPPEHRAAGHEHEVEPAFRIGDRNAGVQGEVQVAIVLVTGLSQLPDRSNRQRRSACTRSTASRFPDGSISSDRPLNASVPTPLNDSVPSTTRAAPRPGQDESAGAHAAGVEELHALAAVGRVGHREAAVDGDVERARLNHAAVLGANLHQLGRRRAGLIHRIHGVAAPIEHVRTRRWRSA